MSKTIELVYNDHAGCYTTSEQLVNDQMRSIQYLGSYETPHESPHTVGNLMKAIFRMSPIILSVVFTSPLPLALYVAPLLSVAMNPNKAGTYPAQKGRRRKGRTNLPLKDVTTGYMSTKCNK